MGIWNGSTTDYNNPANWFGDASNAPGETAIFGPTGATNIVVTSPVNLDGWLFGATSQLFSISGALVTLNIGLTSGALVTETIANDILAPSLLKGGSGTLILTGNNAYSGGVNLGSGTLQIGNGGTTGSLTGDVLDSATLELSRSNSGQIYSGTISGSGNVIIQNTPFAGFTIFTGNNTYTGGTTIASGALVIGNAGTTGSIAGDIVNNDQLTFNRTDSTTFDGLISGIGKMTKFGAGTLTLTADNTYSNGTVIAEGTLQLGNGGTTGAIGSSTLNDGGMLVFDHSNNYSFATSIFGTGSVTQLGSGTT